MDFDTDDYIQCFLTLDQKNKMIAPGQVKLDIILHAEIDHKIVADFIKNMLYEDFLLTDYWRIISKHVRQQNQYKCYTCGKSGYIVHHLNYNSHGYEHRAGGNDLILVCIQCHNKAHPKTPDMKEH